MWQNDSDALKGGDMIGKVLFAYGHNAPINKAFIATTYDSGDVDVVVIREETGRDALDRTAENAIAQCKVTGRKVESITVAAASGMVVGGADAWSSFSSDNGMNAVAEIFFPCDNEGVDEWLRQTFPDIADAEKVGSETFVETLTVLREMSSILWMEFGLERVADVDFMVSLPS